ncbi:Ubiquitin-conjugating enzyme E2 1 [Grifola frondosa]|uniref:Ubiquitin-conjugating enzyme E2 1 n=1 Tax=Grifola frondosa TaxID=5627 RepID=A0A1C7M9N2_GRIFR|nr:Ubiquitin-conjugating enzyme E2 1 [Grifola frondosa]
MDARLRRVNKEIADCKNDKTSRIAIELVNDSPFHLVGSFNGPEGTPYEGGHFQVDIVIPDSYPFQPVKMKFITKVYHPNVSSASGAICLDILKDAWSPVLTLKSTLISLQSLSARQNLGIPKMQKWPGKGRLGEDEQRRGARRSGNGGVDRAHVDQFEALGFDRDKVIDVLRRLNYRGANVANINDDRVVEELLK